MNHLIEIIDKDGEKNWIAGEAIYAILRDRCYTLADEEKTGRIYTVNFAAGHPMGFAWNPTLHVTESEAQRVCDALHTLTLRQDSKK